MGVQVQDRHTNHLVKGSKMKPLRNTYAGFTDMLSSLG